MTLSSNAITLKADIAELDILNTFISKNLDHGYCPRHLRNHIELVAEEIFVNIANYAYTADTGKVTVSCYIEPEQERIKMSLVFCDWGNPFNPLEHDEPDITVPLEERKIGGMGILIVKKIMDTIWYKREDNANHLGISKSWQKETL